jgi:hypothetical protein
MKQVILFNRTKYPVILILERVEFMKLFNGALRSVYGGITWGIGTRNFLFIYFF